MPLDCVDGDFRGDGGYSDYPDSTVCSRERFERYGTTMASKMRSAGRLPCSRLLAQHPPPSRTSSRQVPVARTDDRLHQLVHAHPFRRLPCWNADRYERDALPPHAVVARSARGHSAERGTLRQRYGFDLISFASAAAGNGEVGGTNALTPLTNIR